MNVLLPLSIARAAKSPELPEGDLLCFSHLRWDFVFQRPQHLMERFARHRRILFVEEAIPTAHHRAYLEFHAFDGTPVTAVRPRLPDRATPEEATRLLAGLYDQMSALLSLRAPVLWFYSPMHWPAAAHLAEEAGEQLLRLREAAGLHGLDSLSPRRRPADGVWQLRRADFRTDSRFSLLLSGLRRNGDGEAPPRRGARPAS